MKTIEERAKEYANSNPHGNPYNWTARHDAYIAGATEQKAIDIDKACEWLKAHYKVIYWEVESPTRRGDIGEYLAEDFRTAMEEEL